MSEITLTNGQVALVDEGDLPLLVPLRWYPHNNGYAIAHVNGFGRTVYMHRLVLGHPKGFEVDHINGDKLDNRRGNLRLATRREQMRNVGVRSDSTTGFKGVTPTNKGGVTFSAYIGAGGKGRRRLGSFPTAEEAARAYDAAASAAYGEFAHLNFPEEVA